MKDNKTSLEHQELLDRLGIDVELSLKYGHSGVTLQSLIMGAGLLCRSENEESQEEGKKQLKIISNYLKERRTQEPKRERPTLYTP